MLEQFQKYILMRCLFIKSTAIFFQRICFIGKEELRKISHRDYTQASLMEYAGKDSIYNQREHDENDYVISGIVLESNPNHGLLIDVKSAFQPGDKLEIMPFQGQTIEFKAESIKTISGVDVLKSKPGSVVKIPWISGVEKFNLIRKSLN